LLGYFFLHPRLWAAIPFKVFNKTGTLEDTLNYFGNLLYKIVDFFFQDFFGILKKGQK
jgi:hypothetical protein